jgi:hypothetical protein
LQLFLKGMKVAESADNKADPSQLLKQFADAVLFASDGRGAWRLQSLTDLERLPDYEDGWRRPTAGRAGRLPRRGDSLCAAEKLGRRQKRRRAVALAAGNDGRVEPGAAERRAHDSRPVPA